MDYLYFQLCKHGRQGKREYYYNLGYAKQAYFDLIQSEPNKTDIVIIYEGFGSVSHLIIPQQSVKGDI